MSSPKRIVIVSLFCCLLAGCSRGIKEGFYGITGSSGKIVLIQGDEADIRQLADRYGSVTVEPFTNDIGQACPPEFLSALPDSIAEQLRYRSASFGERIKGKDDEDQGPFFTGPADKSLLISGRVIQYETGDLAGKALGPMEEAICRVQVHDGQTKNILAEANCTGRVKSSIRTGANEMAQGVAKAMRKMLQPAKE